MRQNELLRIASHAWRSACDSKEANTFNIELSYARAFDKISELEKERERLREALEAIAKLCGDWDGDLALIQHIARTALKNDDRHLHHP